jgi:hypothetical protein
MGIVHFLNQRDHWNDSDFLGQQLMTRISWVSIHSSLHFDIKFLRENVTTNFHKIWTTYCHVAVDERIVPFKGRYR